MIFSLEGSPASAPFPDPRLAEEEPDGLLAAHGDLNPQRLVNAYRQGIFPWYSDDQPILWWSPDPRTVIFPQDIHVSRSLRKHLRKGLHTITFDQDFEAVIKLCAAPREGQGTWLLPEMIAAYIELHRLGHAHSIEVWKDDQLVGGLYGIAIGSAFFGESMFSADTDGSKIAIVCLAERSSDWGLKLIDCQVYNPHLETLGAIEIPREEFLSIIKTTSQDSFVDTNTLHSTKINSAELLHAL